MNSQPPINPELRLPPPPPMWVKGAFYTSATALAVSTVAMAVLLAINPQMGIVGFSLLSGAETISCVLFAVSFYLLNRKQDEQLAKLRLRLPELIVEQPFNGEDSSGGDPSSLQGRISRVGPLLEEEHDVPNSGESVVSDTPPELLDSSNLESVHPVLEEDHDVIPEDNGGGPAVRDTPPVLLDRLILGENEGAHSRVGEASSDVPKPTDPHVASEDLSSEDEEDFDLLGSGTLPPMSDVVLRSTTTPIQKAKPKPSIDQFRDSLPSFIKASERFFISLVSAQARCNGKRPSQKTIANIHEAFKNLNIFIHNILKDNNQLFALLLGNMACACVNGDALSEFLQKNKEPNAFLENFQAFFESDEEAFRWIDRIVQHAASGIKTSADRKTFQVLYSALQKADKEIRATEDTMNPFVLIKIPDRFINYSTALMNLVNWLFMKTNPEPSLISKAVEDNVLSLFDSIAQEDIDFAQFLATSYKKSKSAIAEDREKSISIIGKLFSLLNASWSPFPTLYSILTNAIDKSPLKRDYADTLKRHLVNTLIPILMGFTDEALFSNSSKFSLALNQMFNSPPFKLETREDSKPFEFAEEKRPESETSNGSLDLFSKALNQLSDEFDKLGTM